MAKKRTKATDLVSEARDASWEAKHSKAVDDARMWRTRYNKALERETELEKRVAVLQGVAASVSKERRYRKPPKSKARGVAAYVLASDWHVEEVVRPELVSWKNAYNLEIAWKRIERFFQKIVELTHVQNHLAPVEELWLVFLGDLMSGYIHEELKESNELSPVEAIVWLREAIRAGIEFLLSELDVPIYVPTCHGNHGRTTQRKQIKTSYKNSYEWLLYTILAGDYVEHDRVNFMVGKGYHNTVTVMGRKARNHHGDGLRYQGGVGGITIPVNKSVAAWNEAKVVDFDFFGHWHTFLQNYPNWVSNGCIIGYSEFAVEIKAKFQHPTQSFCVIDSAYGLTEAKPIYVEKAGTTYE